MPRARIRLNETVLSIRVANPDRQATPMDLGRAIARTARRARPDTPGRMAKAVWYRYCALAPLSYPEIAIRLGVTAQHARRLTERGIEYLQASGSVRPKRGSRLDLALRDGRIL